MRQRSMRVRSTGRSSKAALTHPRLPSMGRASVHAHMHALVKRTLHWPCAVIGTCATGPTCCTRMCVAHLQATAEDKQQRWQRGAAESRRRRRGRSRFAPMETKNSDPFLWNAWYNGLLPLPCISYSYYLPLPCTWYGMIGSYPCNTVPVHWSTGTG